MGERPRGRRRQLARRLKTLRERNRLTLEEVCEPMQFSTSKLNRIENAENLIDIHELKSLLDIYCVTADRWPEYFDMLAAAKQRGWWRAYGLDDRGYVPMEADASLVRDFSLACVPGLLQTADYARTMLRASLAQRSSERLRNDLAVRMIRQKRLTSADDPLHLVAIVDESALHRPVGGPAVMAEQLAQLVERAALNTVTLQVLPTNHGAHIAQAGTFSLLSFDELGEPDVAYAEHPLGATHTDREAAVSRATMTFDRLRSDALSPADSEALVRRAAEQY
ncbi:MAG TPA: helix-turn-helix transcriptional regulator [Pseudonocardia sp.]|uniref:helix-turn-helix domain-containing protein n=1 Tax=Pseudonocardia sp. TaxID=60912 RepID=UPI002F418B32